MFSFTKSVWIEDKILLKIHDEWGTSNFQDCMYDWFQKRVKFKELPLFIAWETWKA